MEPEAGGPRLRALEWGALLAILLAALWLRTHDLTAFRIGPDDGAYLHSARIHELARDGSLAERVRSDVEWARELADLYADENRTYQHSYLHQLAARWLWRSGFGALESLRLSSAFTGTLGVFLVWLLVRRLAPSRRAWALLAAAFVALSPQHAFLSRTGWGQVGFACFYLAFLIIAHRLLVARPEPGRGTLVRCAGGLAATSLLAFGWQEGVAPYVAGTALVALAAPWIRGERWSPGAALGAGRTWSYVAGAAPAGALTLALMLFSPFAQRVWFDPGGRAQLPWPELKAMSLQNLFVAQRLDLVLTWPILALALAGFVWLRRTDRGAARWLAGNALAGAALLVLFFGDAWLMRAYLPSYLILSILAAGGVAWIAERYGHGAGAAVGCATLAFLGATSWSTLFGRHGGPLFLQHLYSQTDQLDHRRVDEALYDRLQRELRPGDQVVAFGDKAVIYRMLDRGVIAREDYLEGAPETWPRFVVGAVNVFEKRPQFEAHGGPYRLVVRDAVGRHGLYERTGP